MSLLVARRRMVAPHGATPPAGYVATVLADSPLVYYRLNDTTSTTVDQQAVENGTLSGSYSQSATNLLPTGAGASTNFTGGSMAAADIAALRIGSGAFSLECWFNASSLPSFATLIDNASRSYSLLFQDSSHVFVGVGGNSSSSIPIGATLSTGTTYHFVVTVSGTTCVVYVNGSGTTTTLAGGHGATDSSTGVTLAGNPSGGGGLFQGKVQEFAIYGSALSSARVLAHYNAG